MRILGFVRRVINADGVEDLLISARLGDPNGRMDAGESYVVFGDPSIGSSGTVELLSLNGTNGFVLNGIDTGDLAGKSETFAVDVNGNCIDDLIVGARAGDPNGTSTAGESYVVFGRSRIPCSIADVNSDGMLTPADFYAWVAAFNSQSTACDQNGDGLCTPADFSAWVANYNAGCD